LTLIFSDAGTMPPACSGDCDYRITTLHMIGISGHGHDLKADLEPLAKTAQQFCHYNPTLPLKK